MISRGVTPPLSGVSRLAPAAINTAPPVPSRGRSHAFLLASTDRSFADFRAHYEQIGVVYPTYFDCSAAGDLTGSLETLRALVRQTADLVTVPPRTGTALQHTNGGVS